MADTLDRLRTALADRYTLHSELGRGGMATVYLAEDLRHHRQVAIKVLRPDLAATLGPERFFREIEIAARLQHPHILPLLDSGEADDFLYYVMPYVEGHSLRDKLAKEGELPIDDAVRILRDITDALTEAHANGVVHRDIKPENVLLRGRHALVTDFGVAKAVSEATGREQLTTAGVALGTPAYMAPEQASADPHLDHRVDIYAVGAMAYELLSGRPVFMGTTPQMVLSAHVTEAPQPVRTQRESVPPALEAVVMRCLEKKPADRWQTADELLAQLETLATPSGGITPTATLPVGPARPARAFLASPLIWIGLVALALVGVFGSRLLRHDALAITSSNLRQVTRAPGVEIQPAISPDGREVAYVQAPGWTPTVVIRSTVDVGTGAESYPLQSGGGQWFPHWGADGEKLRVFTCPGLTLAEQCTWQETSRLGGGAAIPSLVPRHSEHLVLSPDGTRGAFASHDSLFVYAVGSDEVHLLGVQIVQPWPLHSLAWSPDGRWLAYVNGNAQWRYTGNQSNSSIWLISSAGGDPVRITGDDYADLSPQWLPDSRHLLFVSDRGGARGLYVVRVGAGGPAGDPARVAGAEDAHSISLSRDGRTLAFAKFAHAQNIWSTPIPKDQPARLSDATHVTTENQVIEEHDVSADGRWIVFDSDRRGSMGIYRMELRGGVPALVVESTDDLFRPRISPSGTEIAFYGAFDSTNPKPAVWVVPFNGGVPRLVVDFPGADAYPSWSPDGLALAIHSQGPRSSGGFHIFTIERNSLGDAWKDPVRVTDFPCVTPEWSPDGRHILCNAGSDLVLVTRNGEEVTRVPVGMPFASPTISPDGEEVYFIGYPTDGRPGVWSMPLRGGTPRLRVEPDDPTVLCCYSLTVGPDRLYMTVSEYESDIWVADLDW